MSEFVTDPIAPIMSARSAQTFRRIHALIGAEASELTLAQRIDRLDAALTSEAIVALTGGLTLEPVREAVREVLLWVDDHLARFHREPSTGEKLSDQVLMQVWRERWGFLTGFLATAARTPSAASAARLMLDPESRAADVVRFIDGQPTSPKAIAAQLSVSPSRVSALLNELVDAGVVLRRAAFLDRRKREIVLTPRGLRIARQLRGPEQPSTPFNTPQYGEHMAPDTNVVLWNRGAA